MTDSYKDLDALVPTDKKVQLGGVMYTLPGDLPLEIYLRVNKASELEKEDEAQALAEAVGALVDLFSYYHIGKPEYENVRTAVESVLRKRGIKFNTELLQNVYSEVKEAAEPDPQ